MNLKHILLALIPCIMASACKKGEIMLYEGEESGIFFQTGGQIILGQQTERYADSADFTFAKAPSTTMDTTLRQARVRVMGKVRDYPRPVKVSVDQAKSTAVEGKHFEINYNSVVIPAGASEVYVPVKYKRTADMLNKSFSFVLKLEDNEHFKVYMQTQGNSNNPSRVTAQINVNQFKFIVGEMYVSPLNWDLSFSRFWGPWTATKFKYMNGVLGWTAEDWENRGLPSSPVKIGKMDPAAILVRNKLQALADAHTPMLDEDGKGMQLGLNYQVKY